LPKGRVWKLSETLPKGRVWKLSETLPKGRVWKLSETLPKGRVWKLSETLPKGRVSGSVPDVAGSSVIEFLLGQVLIFSDLVFLFQN
ncbi:hypothetical protein, partial [Leptospira santarosai]